jgi:lipopolysaccharide transport system ATP-binding protein
MAERVILVENLAKCYTLGPAEERGRGFRHVLSDVFKPKEKAEEFWALHDVSFEVKQGETLGIVGRNGAGKSTLLKILSRITEPTRGRIEIEGRVGSLLEVGTGFHPELSGRENIFLNGAILGMQRAEIAKKFDEIVAFAEVEQFLDTPVKHYSSGMYVRLAFAVAAHLDPEILVIDEVLAVGDAQFQKKCLGKVEEISGKQGRTVLFVSHNMGAIGQLCSRALLLEQGRVVMQDTAQKVVARYMNGEGSGAEWKLPSPNAAGKKVFFRRVDLRNHLGQGTAELDVRFPFCVELEYVVPQPLRRIELSVRILTGDGRAVMTSLLSEQNPEAMEAEKMGTFRAAIKIPGMFLMAGNYVLNVAAHEPMGEVFDLKEAVVSFEVRDTGTVFSKYPNHSSIGMVMQSLPWEDNRVSDV